MTTTDSPHLTDDTQPITVTTALPRWSLLALIAFTGLSLLATGALAVALLMSPAPEESSSVAALPDATVPAQTAPREVRLLIDGDAQTIRTQATNPQQILQAQQITLGADDRLWLDGTRAQPRDLATWPVPVNEITIQRTLTVTIRDGDSQTTLQTNAATVGDALYEADIALYEADSVTPNVDALLTDEMRVTIRRAQSVTIRVDGRTLETRIDGSTVGAALAAANVALTGRDYSVPSEDTPIEPAMTINIVRVTEETETYDETIDYEVRYQADADLELDQRRTVQAGQVGIVQHTERVRYENGVEIAREPIRQETVQSVQAQIIAYGTNVVLRPIDTPQGTQQYWRKLRVYATSYHPEALGGDDVTAIGATLRKGIVASNPDIIPYRTDVYVPGYGSGFMADTGGARSSPYWIDLGYSDEDYKSWHQYVDVYLLTPVPETITYRLPAWRPMRGLPDN